MKLFSKISPVILLLFFIPGCTEKKADLVEVVLFENEKPTTTDFQIKKNQLQVVDLSEVPSLIGKIRKIEFYKNWIIIFDGELKIINRDTNEIKHLANKGKGPFEYLSVSAIKANENGVFYLDYQQSRLQQVSFDGDPLLEINIESNPLDFALLNDHLVALFHGSHPFQGASYRVSVFDIQKNEHAQRHIPFPPHHYDFLHFIDWNNFATYNNSIYLSHSGSTKIYKFQDDFLLTPQYEINFGEKTLTDEMLAMEYDEVIDFVNQMDSRDVFYRINSAYVIKNQFVFSTRQKDGWYICTFDLGSKKSRMIDQITINDSPAIKINQDLVPRGYFNEQLVIVFEPHIVLDSPVLMNALKEYGLNTSNLSVDGNPILVFVDEEVFAMD